VSVLLAATLSVKAAGPVVVSGLLTVAAHPADASALLRKKKSRQGTGISSFAVSFA